MASEYTYSDMSSGMEVSSTGAVKILYDEDVIMQSIRNIFATISNERVRNAIGSSLVRLLFTPMTKEAAGQIRTLVRQSIERYEPRVKIEKIIIIPKYDLHYYDITIEMTIAQISRNVTFKERIRTFV